MLGQHLQLRDVSRLIEGFHLKAVFSKVDPTSNATLWVTSLSNFVRTVEKLKTSVFFFISDYAEKVLFFLFFFDWVFLRFFFLWAFFFAWTSGKFFFKIVFYVKLHGLIELIRLDVRIMLYFHDAIVRLILEARNVLYWVFPVVHFSTVSHCHQ